MNSDLPAEPSSSSLEEFLAGAQDQGPRSGGVGIVAPPLAEDPRRERIMANIRTALTHQLRSETLEVLPSGMTVRTQGNVGEFDYQPDLIVDVRTPAPGAKTAFQPQVIFEVAATGTERSAFIGQWQVFRSLPLLAVYVFVDASLPAVTLYRRKGSEWNEEVMVDPDDQLFLPTIHSLLSLETIYAGVFTEDDEIQVPSVDPKITLS